MILINIKRIGVKRMDSWKIPIQEIATQIAAMCAGLFAWLTAQDIGYLISSFFMITFGVISAYNSYRRNAIDRDRAATEKRRVAVLEKLAVENRSALIIEDSKHVD
jgi:hypothetical protein